MIITSHGIHKMKHRSDISTANAHTQGVWEWTKHVNWNRMRSIEWRRSDGYFQSSPRSISCLLCGCDYGNLLTIFFQPFSWQRKTHQINRRSFSSPFMSQDNNSSTVINKPTKPRKWPAWPTLFKKFAYASLHLSAICVITSRASYVVSTTFLCSVDFFCRPNFVCFSWSGKCFSTYKTAINYWRTSMRVTPRNGCGQWVGGMVLSLSVPRVSLTHCNVIVTP